jgi:drug/metabolite transporter (DMT)-like permease
MPESSSSHTNLARGYPIALAAAAILSTTAIFIRYLTQTYHMPPLLLAFWREVFVALALLPALAIARRLHVQRAHLAYLLGYGLMLAIFNSLWTLSVALNGAAVSTVLVYCSAGFTALLGWWLLKERLDWAMLVAVVCSLGGCVLVADALAPAAWQANLAGIVTGVLSGLWYAIYSLMGRSAARRGLNPWTTLLYTFGFAGGFLLLANLLPLGIPGAAAGLADFLWLGSAWMGWVVLLLLAVGPTLAGYGLYNVSLSYLPSSLAQLIVTLEPVFTAVTAYFILGERLTRIQITGSLVILGSVMFLRLYEGRRTQKMAVITSE